jgi:transketolase C-terminal domain/subunit
MFGNGMPQERSQKSFLMTTKLTCTASDVLTVQFFNRVFGAGKAPLAIAPMAAHLAMAGVIVVTIFCFAVDRCNGMMTAAFALFRLPLKVRAYGPFKLRH